MRDRNAGVCGGSDARGHSGYDLKSNAGGSERLRLFASPAEHEWIAALETDDSLAIRRQSYQDHVDLILLRGLRRPATLADVNQLDAPQTGGRKQAGIGERIVD